MKVDVLLGLQWGDEGKGNEEYTSGFFAFKKIVEQAC